MRVMGTSRSVRAATVEIRSANARRLDGPDGVGVRGSSGGGSGSGARRGRGPADGRGRARKKMPHCVPNVTMPGRTRAVRRGIDIAAGVGTRGCRAVGQGHVRRSARVVRAHGRVATADGGYATSYLHLSRIAVERSESVGAGHEIGAVGTTGKRSTEATRSLTSASAAQDPHASVVDPLTLLPSVSGQGLTPSSPVVAPAPVRPRLQAAPIPVRPRFDPVPAGLLHPHRHRAPTRVPALTPEPSPFSDVRLGASVLRGRAPPTAAERGQPPCPRLSASARGPPAATAARKAGRRVAAGRILSRRELSAATPRGGCGGSARRRGAGRRRGPLTR